MSEFETSKMLWRDRVGSIPTGSFAEWRSSFEPWFATGETLRQGVSATQNWRIRLTQGEALLPAARRFTTELFAALGGPEMEFLRVESLVEAASQTLPRLGFDPEQIAQDATRPLGEKTGVDLFQGVLLSALLDHPEIAGRIMRDMRRPKPSSLEQFNTFLSTDRLDLGAVRLEKNGAAGIITFTTAESLNAEDDPLLEAFETAVDLVLMHPDIRVGVLRGGPVSHPKYPGKRVFCSGINLTKLIDGRISYLFFIARELGVMNKIYRGLAVDPTDALSGAAFEKPWIGAVETHAIGGGVQMLLVLDHVLAEEDAFLSVPARTEGFIPGLANLRLPRLVGVRAAHRIVEQGIRVTPSEPMGQSLVDVSVPAGTLDAALSEAIDHYQTWGSIGAIANRRSFRCAEEPEAVFRDYMAQFCLEQARCLLDPVSADHLRAVWTNR